MPKLLRSLTLVALVAAPLTVAACGSSSSSGGSSKLTLAAYSTPKEAYSVIIPAFQKTAAGKGVTFSQSYGASGEQSRAVEAGLKANIVAFSLSPDVNKLVKAGLVDANWNQGKYKGNVTDSVVVLTVRKGNPKNLKTFNDLAKPGVQVLTPNPFTSGGAKWNIMAIYGSQLSQGKSPKEALDFLKSVLKNVPVQDKSGRESLQTFLGGKGDVAITYENESLTALAKGEKVYYVIPDDTLLIENPAAVVKTSGNLEKAKAFLDFLTTPEAQKLYASKGYRPVDKDVLDTNKFPSPKGLFDIQKFGGWSKVNDEFFDPQKGSVTKIEQELGVSTAK
jgi:sulfate/thiosulfate-binding protein